MEIRTFEAADAPWIVERHRALYAVADGFDDSFGQLVASILAEFVAAHDATSERGWVVWNAGARAGSLFCVRLDAQTAKLRLFLLEPEMRGRGVGQQLLDHCMGFARDAGYASLRLWTHESHHAACALYARNGFTCVSSRPVHSFGQDLVEQEWARAL